MTDRDRVGAPGTATAGNAAGGAQDAISAPSPPPEALRPAGGESAREPGAPATPADTAPPGFRARWVQRTTGGAPLFPLFVLFGLNMVDELDRTAFGILLPEIRDHFGLNTSGILTVVSLSLIGALVLAIPIGFHADRGKRVRIARLGATGWGVFSVFTGLAPTLWALGIARSGSSLGRAVNEPVHNSLLADFYDIPVRPRVYGVHRYANAIGQFLGPMSAGVIAYAFGWRAPFIVFGIPTFLFVLLALRLREPTRGHFERRAMGASEAVIATDEESPSFAESWRILGGVRSLQRVFHALPFIAISIVGLLTLGALFYEEVFNLDERARGFLSASVEPAQLLGLVIGIPIATRLMARDPALVLRMLSGLAFVVASAWVVFALAPNLGVAVGANVVISGCMGILLPGTYAIMSLAIPAKVRSFGFAVGTLWILPGLALLPIVGWVADEYGIRSGLLLAAPVFMVGGLVLASAGKLVTHDVQQVWRSAAARSEVAHLRREGKIKLLLARGIDVHYDNVQVLFGVDIEVDEGEIVALLGTNGAGKSTLLKAISGLVQPSGGAVVFDGRDMTHTPPDEVAGRGVTQVPGGQGVFGQLSVHDNLRLAAWQQRRRPAEAAAATAQVLDMFPMLRDRLDEPAGNLSGGQQQMLTLGMAFIGRPRLLMIDELSLGLAPAVVTQLLDLVRELRDRGTTIILVEQSVNVALTVADRAYFLEKGEVRFEGPTSELLERPDLLRSVFLHAAGSAIGGQAGADGAEPAGDGAQSPAAAAAAGAG
ncbi:MAG: ATP-binding protein, partial [Acidimicrobiia bacterium]